MAETADEGPPYAFDPDWTVAPGATLAETLGELGLSPDQLAERSGLPPVEVQGILGGILPISEDAAGRLERVTGVPAGLWSRLDASYWADLRRGLTRVL